MKKNTAKSWRKGRTGKILATNPLIMHDTTEQEIGTAVVCGVCGTHAPNGFRLTEESSDVDWDSLSPKFMLLGLEYFRNKSSSAHIHNSYRWENGTNWYLGNCCKKTFSRNCADLGFKILHKRKRRRWDWKLTTEICQKSMMIITGNNCTALCWITD